jgi:cell division transport system permease protein
MLILGLFFMLAVNIDVLSQRAEEQFDMVELYLKDSVSDTERMALSEKIGAMECVETVQYVSKEKALKIMKKRWGNNGYLLDGLSSNPLPASLQVKMKTIGKTAGFVKTIRKEKGVEDVACRQDEIDKIMKITEHIQIGAVIVIFFLIIVSVVVVANTIRLTVLARGSAISIMKYVGATNWFIRAPFLMEGIIIGVAAALLSALIVSGLYEAFADHYSERSVCLG